MNVNMKISTRITLGFGMVVALTLGLGLYSLGRHSDYQQFAAEMRNRDFRVLEDFGEINRVFGDMRYYRARATAAFLATNKGGSGSVAAEMQQSWSQTHTRLTGLLAPLRSAIGEFGADTPSPARACRRAVPRHSARNCSGRRTRKATDAR
jgi:hypothetical protein